MNGKGDKPRNIGPKFKENFDGIDWRKKPKMVIGNIYLYSARQYKEPIGKEMSYKYLGKVDLKGCMFYQMEHYPDKNLGGIYLNDDEIKDLKEVK
jgi:hypothetical protein